MRAFSLLAALLVLAPLAAVPAGGSFHQSLAVLPDRDHVLVMRGTGFNGFAYPDTPLLEAFLGETVRFTVLVPAVAEPHTFHLHGHPWFIPEEGSFVDTVLLRPGEVHSFTVAAGSVDGEAGDWMYHCHIETHQAAGMWGIFRVYPFATRVVGEGPHLLVTLDRLGEPLSGARLALTLDGAPVAAEASDLGGGRYAVHADLPADAAGTLAVTAAHPLGTSVARHAIGGASPEPPTLALTGAHAH